MLVRDFVRKNVKDSEYLAKTKDWGTGFKVIYVKNSIGENSIFDDIKDAREFEQRIKKEPGVTLAYIRDQTTSRVVKPQSDSKSKDASKEDYAAKYDQLKERLGDALAKNDQKLVKQIEQEFEALKKSNKEYFQADCSSSKDSKSKDAKPKYQVGQTITVNTGMRSGRDRTGKDR